MGQRLTGSLLVLVVQSGAAGCRNACLHLSMSTCARPSSAAHLAALTPAEITGAAAKVLTFLDMGGHEKYLKTALYGMTALLPDYR